MSNKIKIKIVNKKLPNGFDEFWDNFDEKKYLDYLNAKKKYRIKKIISQN